MKLNTPCSFSTRTNINRPDAGSSDISSDVKTGDSVHRLYKKHFKHRIYFPSLRLASNSDKPLKRASSLRHCLNFKHCHDMPLGKDIQR